jgi:putative spermidine/putrescine transport system ATP-binding protein
VSLHVKDGEFISLLGESGCGKTTLLKSIAGLLEVESGDILMNGKSIMNVAPEKRGTVIVFQDLRLFPHLTVEKNIAFAMEIKKISKTEQKETVRKLLEEVQLVGYENRKIGEMSGGQMQRVALARALAAKPNILLLDEPFSGLDERLRVEIRNLVLKLQKERKITTILVTHDSKEAIALSDRIAMMEKGEIVRYETAEKTTAVLWGEDK